MFSWKKLGLIFNPLDYKNNSWIQEFSQTPNTLEFDDFIRIYFTTRMNKDKNGRLKSLIAYADYDKNNLFQPINISSKPVLELGDRGHFDEFGTYLFAPLRIDENKIYSYYVGMTATESVPINSSIGLAISYDNGNTFKKIGVGPVLSHSLHEPFLVSSHKIRRYNNLFYLFYITGYKWATQNNVSEPVYKIRLATSEDGINWSKLNRNIIPDKIGELEAQACPDIFYKNGKYHMFFCYRGAFDYRHNKKNSYRIGYAYSHNLLDWERNDKLAGIDISPEDSAFDNEMVAYPHVFELNNNIYMLYVGNEVGRFGIGLAVLNGDLN